MLNYNKRFARFTAAALVTSVAVGGVAISTLAENDTNIDITNVVSNDLLITFSVADIVKNEIIALTWGNNVGGTADKDVNMQKNTTESIYVDVAQGTSFADGDVESIDVIFKIASDDAEITLENGDTLDVILTQDEDGTTYSYYVLKQGLAVDTDGESFDFDISFSNAADDIDASIFAVKSAEEVEEVYLTIEGNLASHWEDDYEIIVDGNPINYHIPGDSFERVYKFNGNPLTLEQFIGIINNNTGTPYVKYTLTNKKETFELIVELG